ncbi:MAG: hypothetical protein CVU62_02120 [Deltaproteobacteria bacterium HGW-Deltaproteobacteria-2]|nr:MAG: hypothetical protein CVU62_02120 [Deltaproteobacteria bacterium HGW-Deltaproteobacteria-2]
MNLLFGFSITISNRNVFLILNPDRLCRMVPAAGFNPVEQTMKCFLQFDSETGLELHHAEISRSVAIDWIDLLKIYLNIWRTKPTPIIRSPILKLFGRKKDAK